LPLSSENGSGDGHMAPEAQSGVTLLVHQGNRCRRHKLGSTEVRGKAGQLPINDCPENGKPPVTSGEVRSQTPPRSLRSTCRFYSPLHIVPVGRELMLCWPLGLHHRTGHHGRGNNARADASIGTKEALSLDEAKILSPSDMVCTGLMVTAKRSAVTPTHNRSQGVAETLPFFLSEFAGI
jgi:hypothetical protein